MPRYVTFEFVIFFCFSQNAFASERIDTNYNGPDAGTLVFSVSTLKISMDFAFSYKRAEDPPEKSLLDADQIRCKCAGFWHAAMPDPDFNTGYETGKVRIQHLRPGKYEVYSFEFIGSSIGDWIIWHPKKPFSIPFTIKPGETTYIGNFARAPSLGTPKAAELGAAGFFVVSDKHQRDIEIARTKRPDLPPVTVSVTDVSEFGVPFFLASDPYAPRQSNSQN